MWFRGGGAGMKGECCFSQEPSGQSLLRLFIASWHVLALITQEIKLRLESILGAQACSRESKWEFSYCYLRGRTGSFERAQSYS